MATPKDLWQDYGQVDNYITASRLKHYARDNLAAGATFTTRTGLNTEDGDKADSVNYVGGGDLSYEFMPGLKAQTEILGSQSYYDQTDPIYKTQSRGGSGIKTAEITQKTGALVSAHVVTDEKEIFALSAKGQMIRTDLGTVRGTGRSAQGVRIMNLKSGDRLAGTVVV